MRTFFLALSFLLASACAVLRADDDSLVLWWRFDDDTLISDVNGGGTYTIDTLEGRGDAAGKTVNAIRIGAYEGDKLLGYLTIGEDADAYYKMPSPVWAEDPPGSGEYVETGTYEWNAGPEYANLAGYSSNPEVSFMIELGNWDGSLGAGNEWQVLAHSDAETMDALRNKGFIDVSDWEMHGTLEWTGGSYAVPEPSSGLLILIGGALLALRRRRRAV